MNGEAVITSLSSHQTTMSLKPEQLHFLLVPLMSQSHIIPLTHLAKSLAGKGSFVSIVTTPLNTITSLDNSNSGNLRIQTIPISFPWREAGLPEGCERLDALTSMELAGKFFHACEMLQGPLEKLIGEMNPKPNCIVSTNAVPWTQKVADKFSIPRYVFETVSCFTLMCSDHLSRGNVLKTVVSDFEPFLVPDLPHQIEFTKAQLPKTLRKGSDGFEKFGNQIEQARESAKGTLVNSFQELEPWYVERRKDGTGKVWCIGPVSLSKKDLCDDLFSVEGHYCLKWLDKMKPNSVVYACFGSLCSMSSSQMKQIALGLEASNFPFIWIIRVNDYSSEVENWLKQEKFEERVGERGVLVLRGWVPQVAILSHPSVGGFLTHCGWNSTLEGVSAGVPMITWPMFADQFYNEKFIVDVLGIGVRVGVERSIDYRNCERVEDLVRWNKVKNAVENVMDGEREDGVKKRRRAKELAEMASDAVKRGGSSYSDVEMFVQDVINTL